MGKKAGELHINAKKFGGLAKPCMKDMMTYLGCLSLNHNNDDKCIRQREQLSACMETQTGKKRKPWGTLNYHLQRLNRGRKHNKSQLFKHSLNLLILNYLCDDSQVKSDILHDPFNIGELKR
ncbi:hypothetical protein M8C21_032073 [Ambrosia artemisiifolia]|uniref:IMS import disulfide relay-system CHCH-CHCH-like Cx9C domain-containing protein n=1 Tax=Ambrosia artemisiifolia TaxID=4212 RepID=A0AAD5GHR7_AMBAR|nr:hypothetical protein M8C21_032073 [Ambrosia artemisiifolia]